MHCSTFRELHLAFVDDTLPGADRTAMERHRRDCERCARHDAVVRRGLMLVRNSITPIEPSPDFYARLQDRLHGVEADRRPVYVTRHRSPAAALTSARGLPAVAAAACALLAVGVAAWSAEKGGDVPSLTMSAAVTAAAPAAARLTIDAPEIVGATGLYPVSLASEAYDVYLPDVGGARTAGAHLIGDRAALDPTALDPALVATTAAGLSVWPALLLADDLPRPFREAGFSVAGLQR